jgi:hypothetical protein
VHMDRHRVAFSSKVVTDDTARPTGLLLIWHPKAMATRPSKWSAR